MGGMGEKRGGTRGKWRGMGEKARQKWEKVGKNGEKREKKEDMGANMKKWEGGGNQGKMGEWGNKWVANLGKTGEEIRAKMSENGEKWGRNQEKREKWEKK